MRGNNPHTASSTANFYEEVKATDLSHYIDRKSRLGFFVQMPIEYLHFNFGGETRVFTLNQLQVLRFAHILADEHHLC